MSHFKVSPFEAPPLLKRPKTTETAASRQHNKLSSTRKRQVLLQQLVHHQQEQMKQQNNNSVTSGGRVYNTLPSDLTASMQLQQPQDDDEEHHQTSTRRNSSDTDNLTNSLSGAKNNNNNSKLTSPPPDGTSPSAQRVQPVSPSSPRGQQQQHSRPNYSYYSSAQNMNNLSNDQIHLLLSPRLGRGTSGTAERGDEDFETREEAAERKFREWKREKDVKLHQKKKEEEAEALANRGELERLRQQRNFTPSSPSPFAYEPSPPSSKRSKSSKRRNGDDGEDNYNNNTNNSSNNNNHSPTYFRQRNAERQVSAFRLTSERRAQERASWERAQFAKYEAHQQILKEKQAERKKNSEALKKQKQDRDEYLSGLLNEKDTQLREARLAAAAKILHTKMASSTLIGGGSSSQLTEEDLLNIDPQLVLEQMRNDRMNLGVREETARMAEERRRARKEDEETVRSARREQVLRNRDAHDSVVIEEISSARLRRDIQSAKTEAVQDATASQKQKFKTLLQEQEEGRKERIDTLTQDRKAHINRRYENYVKHHDHVKSIVDEVSQQKKEAQRKRTALRNHEGPEFEERRIRAEEIRRETSLSPRINKEEHELERHMIVYKMKSDFNERKIEYELEAKRELQERRENVERARKARLLQGGAGVSGASSRPNTAPGYYDTLLYPSRSARATNHQSSSSTQNNNNNLGNNNKMSSADFDASWPY